MPLLSRCRCPCRCLCRPFAIRSARIRAQSGGQPDVWQPLVLFSCSVSHTTRPARDGEQNNIDYYFVSAGEMNEAIDQGRFLQTSRILGHIYGVSSEAVDAVAATKKIGVLCVETEGVAALRLSHLKPIYVCLMPPADEWDAWPIERVSPPPPPLLFQTPSPSHPQLLSTRALHLRKPTCHHHTHITHNANTHSLTHTYTHSLTLHHRSMHRFTYS